MFGTTSSHLQRIELFHQSSFILASVNPMAIHGDSAPDRASPATLKAKLAAANSGG
ncbi:MAG: hypothetical protein OXP73_10135 [Chloroflexota bacterium]|nr:hypothetical protein [Chloroflexota bacterium]